MKKGDLRVCVITKVPPVRYYTVPSVEVGLLLINTLKNEMLLHEHHHMLMLEEYLGDPTEENVLGWREWYSEDGNTENDYELTDDFKLVLSE